MSERLRIAMIDTADPAVANNSWVGTFRRMKAALEKHVGDVTSIGPAPINLLPYRVMRRVMRFAFSRRYSYYHDPALARRFAHWFSAALAEGNFDLVYAPVASSVVAYLDTTLPVVYYSDITWKLMEGYYADFTALMARSREGAAEIEERAIGRADVLLYPTAWAARSAMEDYGAPAARVFTISPGANFAAAPPRELAQQRRTGGTIELLLVGMRWESKGGPIALAVLEALLARGVDAHLTVVGCTAPTGVAHERMTVIPFLNAAIDAERERFAGIWRRATLFLLPTRYEASGHAFCEAAAYGLPAITTDTGGVADIVHSGRNGLLVAHDATPDEYADVIVGITSDPERYAALCRSSREEFERRLNWDTWGAGVAAAVGATLPELIGRLPR